MDQNLLFLGGFGAFRLPNLKIIIITKHKTKRGAAWLQLAGRKELYLKYSWLFVYRTA